MLFKFKKDKDFFLFSSPACDVLTYSMFSKGFKKLLIRAGIHGNFASHSLRRGGGGGTFMSMINCPLSQIRARGRWKSDCVYRYIKPPLNSKIVADKKVAS